MKQNYSWEANSFSASQEILRILRNSKVPYHNAENNQFSLSWAR